MSNEQYLMQISALRSALQDGKCNIIERECDTQTHSIVCKLHVINEKLHWFCKVYQVLWMVEH